MFTGIVQDLGHLRRARPGEVEIDAPSLLANRLEPGASVAVNGVCLTVRSRNGDTFRAELSSETLRRTTFASLLPPSRVNLELPVGVEGVFDGHLVLGHVDAIGRIQALYREEKGWVLIAKVPSSFCRYVVEKGSIAVDGISLTPYDVRENVFRCSIVPETYERTALQDRKSGDPVNLEFDVLAKYVERMIRFVYPD